MTFDPFNSQYFLQIIFQIEDEDNYPPYNDRFDFLGYNSSNFIYLIGPPIFVFMFYLACLFILPLLMIHPRVRQLKIVQSVKKYALFNGLIRLVIEISLESSFSIVLMLLYLKTGFNNMLDVATFGLTFAFAAFIFIIMIPLPIILHVNY